MKYLYTLILVIFVICCRAQSLQLHYDLRHSFDPARNPKNYATLYFEYFKSLDSGKSFIKPGAFLLKTEADFAGDESNIGKYYMQVSQEFRFWQPKVFITLQYAGGLGITTPRQYSYYIINTYSAGISYHYKIGDAYLSSILFYKYVPYTKPTSDFLYTMYFYKGLFNYKADIEGNFSIWTENKNHGDTLTETLYGKRFFFFAEPQLWYNFNRAISAGTKLNSYYHVNFTGNFLEVYPTIALRLKFNK